MTYLLALAPALLAVAIFAATLLRIRRPPGRAMTKARREWVAARAQTWRVGVVVIGALVVLGAVASLHLDDFRRDPFIPLELS